MGWGRQALAVLLLACLAGNTAAYPVYFASMYANGCNTAQPTSALGAHRAPRADPTITFKAVAADGTAVKQLCTGEEYTIQVSFPEPRNMLATASAGALAGGAAQEQPCAKRVYSSTTPEDSFTFEYTAPTSDTSVDFAVTSATGVSSAFLQTSARMLVAPCGAAAAAPAQAVASPTAAPAKAATPPAPAKAATVPAIAPAKAAASPAVPVAAAPPVAAVAAGQSASTCTPSPLGYQCMHTTASGAVLHYSRGGRLPDNACTRGTSATGDNANAAEDEMLHFALSHSNEGYLGLSFPKRVGFMSPAEAVIGYAHPSKGPYVGTYMLQGVLLGEETTASNWAVHRGYVRSSGGGVLCFSRPVASSVAMELNQALNPASVPVNYASASSNDLTAAHNSAGGLTLDLSAAGGGGSVGGEAPVKSNAMMRAHGALMLVAFAGLMPLGVLLARHKWAFGRKEGGISPVWFTAHIGVQVLAVVTAVVSIILAFVDAGLVNPGHSLWKPHQVIGVLAVAMSVVQLAIGFFRPKLDAPQRTPWFMLHGWWGRLALLLGWVNIFLGVVLMHDLKAQSLEAWLIAAVVLIGFFMAALLVLEILKFKLENQGRYNPATHTYGSDGLPTAKPGAAATVDLLQGHQKQ